MSQAKRAAVDYFVSQQLSNRKACTLVGMSRTSYQYKSKTKDEPGKPMQNAYIERKNGSIRRELLNAYMFNNLTEARAMSQIWRTDYNNERPHKSLGYLSPIKYAQLNNQQKVLSTPASENRLKIEAKPVVDNAVKQILNTFKYSKHKWY